MRRDSLFTIAPHSPFLETLCDRVLDGTLMGDWPRSGPFWLSDVTIILPTRRARQQLAALFAKRLGPAALLPDLRTFGGEVEDEEPFLPPFDADPLPDIAPESERLLFLATLVDAWARSALGAQLTSSPPSSAEVFALARSLGQLRDDLTIEGVGLSGLEGEIAELDLAAHWQATRRFLTIALEGWPAALADSGRVDPVALRNLRLVRQAETAPLLYGDRPVIAAGSTGSVPATATLLAAVANLPRGAVVLPGLDTGLAPSQHAQLLDPGAANHAHPQYGLARLLRRLNSSPQAVIELAEPPTHPRTRLVRTALAMAEETAHWAVARAALQADLAPALEGVALLSARTTDEEARAIAVLARHHLAEGRTIGIIAPDQTLARRIAAELLRFGIEIDDAAGVPLFQSAAGRLVRQALALSESDFAAVDLVALLQNRATTLGYARAELSPLIGRLELGLLRGQRPMLGLDGLRRLLAANLANALDHPRLRLSEADGVALTQLFDRLQHAFAPLIALRSGAALRAADLVAAIGLCLERLTDGHLAEIPGGDGLLAFIAEYAARPGEGPALSTGAPDRIIASLMAGRTVPSRRASRSDIAIWGRLEARLMAPDVLVLSGLNEDIWPEPADPGPWLSRQMRIKVGLEPPERQQGQAAHDFEMAMGNGEVVLSHALRRGSSPALPSRLLQRLEAVIGTEGISTLRQRGDVWLDLARRIDLADRPALPAPRPAPRPAASLRPRQLAITELETLFRSPYDIYARHVLGLRRLAALGEAPDARERGSMIHKVFARFVDEGRDASAPDALARLEQMAEEAFAGLDAIGERRDLWLKRFSLVAAQFLAFEQRRAPRIALRKAEVKGAWSLALAEPFTLVGRADRIDRTISGTLEILDFKTGALPSPKAMQAFEAPQLLLEALMARAGAFGPELTAEASALLYLKVGLGPEALQEVPFKPREGLDLSAASDEVGRRVQRQVEALLLSGEAPMVAALRPDPGRRYAGDYDHLARLDEWAMADLGGRS